MMLIDLTHNRFQKNDAITRAAWMLCAGAEKRAEKEVFLHSINRDEAENFMRFQLARCSAASLLWTANDFRAV
jgi:hypothetical protein